MYSPLVKGIQYRPMNKSKKKSKAAAGKAAVSPSPLGDGLVRRTMPSAFGTTVTTGKPIVSRSDGRSIRIRHREQAGILNPSPVWTIGQEFWVNPGLADTFPWLSTQAGGWQQYRFNRLALRYVPRCSTSSPGVVSIAHDYDVLDPAPISEVIMMSYYGAVQDACWANILMELDPVAMHPDGRSKFIRDGIVPGSDLKTYDVGAMYISPDGFDVAANAAGNLFWEYDVELSVPQTKSPDFRPPLDWVFSYTSAPQNVGASNTSVTVLYQTMTGARTDVLGVSLNTSTGVFTMPKGWFKISFQVSANFTSVGGTASFYSYPRVNGVDVNPALIYGPGNTTYVAGQYGTMTCTGIEVLPFNLNDTLDIRLAANYSAGTPTYSASITIELMA